MTEFMTQRELAEEFLLFLGQDKDVKKQFLDDIKYGYPQATPYNVGGKKLATFASVGDDPIKYIMEMSKKDKIINLWLPLDCSMQPIPTPNTQIAYYDFCIFFNKKYKKEIARQAYIGLKVLIRYLKEEHIELFKYSEKLETDVIHLLNTHLENSPALVNTIPSFVLDAVYTFFPSEMQAEIYKGYSNFYKKLLELQQCENS